MTNPIAHFYYFAAHQVKVLTEKYHIYLVSNGRVSMAGFNTKNVNYVADAIKYDQLDFLMRGMFFLTKSTGMQY